VVVPLTTLQVRLVTNVVGGNIKLTLDASLLPLSPALSLSEGSCAQSAESTFVYNCVTDLTERVTFTFTVPSLPDYSVLDFTATLFDANENDCAVDTQSILVAPPASPTPPPATCAARSCPIAGFASAPCLSRNVNSSLPVCMGGRCRTLASACVDCASEQCAPPAVDGTPCAICTCACAAMVPGVNGTKLNVRDCGTAAPTTAPTPVPTSAPVTGTLLVWLVVLSVLTGLTALAFCCYLFVGAAVRRRRQRKDNEKTPLVSNAKFAKRT
jgi:hypothetical protein